jgi:hypothetical protein
MSQEAFTANDYTVNATVKREADGNLHASYDQPILSVYGTGATIYFNLDTAIAGVVFKSIDIEPQGGAPGSDIPAGFRVVSITDYRITITDANNGAKTSTYYVKFQVFDPRKNTDVTIDPQIINRG